MKTMVQVFGLLLLLMAPAPARALIGTTDDVPAATLLLPYFEVDPNGTGVKGVDTLFTISNASATAILSHVTVWTDAAVPIFVFNVYLTGYDRQQITMRSLLAGNYPQTASAGQDQMTSEHPSDSISPHGPYSQDINFASCNGQLPQVAASADTVASWRAAFSGKSSAVIGGCAGFDHGDDILRGFVTVDTVNNCTLRKPGDVGYFIAGGSGDATNQNVQWGEYTIVDRSSGRRHTSRMVAIEASPTSPETSVAGQYTFYGRLVNWTAADNREPLATTFGAPYDLEGAIGHPSRTTLVVWRDPKVKQGVFSCNSTLAWFPLSLEGASAFDDQERAQVLSPGANAFGLAAQRVAVDSGALPVNFSSGWMFLNLNATVAAAGANPPEDPAAAQAWVDVFQDDADTGAYGARGHLGVMNRAVPFDSAATTGSSHTGPYY